MLDGGWIVGWERLRCRRLSKGDSKTFLVGVVSPTQSLCSSSASLSLLSSEYDLSLEEMCDSNPSQSMYLPEWKHFLISTRQADHVFQAFFEINLETGARNAQITLLCGSQNKDCLEISHCALRKNSWPPRERITKMVDQLLRKIADGLTHK